MGSHATCSGAWVSGPEDLSPPEYFWGYNRMLTIDGLFGAGDTVGGSAHKFSSGSFTEGRLAAKAAVKYIEDKKAEGLKVSDKQCEDFKTKVYKPLETYTVAQNEITGGTVSPSYISPIQGLQRLQRIMDEYVGGIATNYMTNANMLKRGLELLAWLEEDLENVGAEDYHQLMRAWELKHRALTSQCVTEHTMFREETRWPGYYYRGDHMKLDDDNWHCLTVSRRDPKTGKFSMEKVPVYHIVDENEKKKAS
jgi:adenylylsulfate reductase subunit A